MCCSLWKTLHSKGEGEKTKEKKFDPSLLIRDLVDVPTHVCVPNYRQSKWTIEGSVRVIDSRMGATCAYVGQQWFILSQWTLTLCNERTVKIPSLYLLLFRTNPFISIEILNKSGILNLIILFTSCCKKKQKHNLSPIHSFANIILINYSILHGFHVVFSPFFDQQVSLIQAYVTEWR